VLRARTALQLAGILFLLDTLCGPALAGSGGSSYSLFGVGDIRYASGVRSAGMGYTGVGIADAAYINGFSPASWARLSHVRLEASLLYEGFKSTDGTHDRFLSRADFNGALLAIPLSPSNGVVMVAGIVPFSTVNYDAYTSGGYITPTDTMAYKVHHVGTGGITRGIIGLTYAPSEKLAFGFSTNVLFGSIDAQEIQEPLNTSYTGGAVTDRVTTNGVEFSLGGLYTDLGDIIPSLRTVSLGAVITSRGVLSARNQTLYRFTSSESTAERDTSAELERQTVFPLSFAIGIGYRPSERLLIATDYSRQLWSKAVINDLAPTSLRDSYRLGIGIERTPTREPYAPYGQQLAYRLGAYYHATYYQPKGEPINEWGITAGAGFPFSGESRLNVALEYARRGTTSTGLIKDTILRLYASVNIGALWFVQYPEE
jgi:hypothetical protein